MGRGRARSYQVTPFAPKPEFSLCGGRRSEARQVLRKAHDRPGNFGVTTSGRRPETIITDKFLRWDGWGGQAKESLSRQAQLFDLAPIVARYVNAANEFAAWFWDEINRRSASLIDEMMNKAMELKLWHDENVGPLSGLSAVT